MNTMSSIRRDFVASYLRTQLSRINNILDNIEEEKDVDCDYAYKSLKEIEVNLRQIRKLCASN